jgi:uncharacterized membrane protein HdeD (DUF308 family)
MLSNWWLFACRAVFAFVFAMYVFFIEGANLPFLLSAFAHASAVALFGILAFGAGIFTLAAALRPANRGHHRGLLLVDGLGACAAGAIVVLLPSFTLVHLVQVIGFWAAFVGLCEIFMAHTIRDHLPDEWFLVIAGVGSFALGIFLLLRSSADDQTVLAWLGSYALFSAICMSGVAYRLWLAQTHHPAVARILK